MLHFRKQRAAAPRDRGPAMPRTAPSRNGASSRRETPAQLQRSTTAARAAARSAARSSADRAEQLREPLREIGRVPRVEGGEMAELGRICRLQAGGDLGQPRMPRDERRAAGRRRLRRDHAECLGEDGRHDTCVGERE